MYSCVPNNVENPDCPEGPFWWESPDGSRILAYRLLAAYGSGPEEITPDSVRKISGFFNETVKDEMFFYGVGDHGGGPTIRNIQSILEMQKDSSLPNLVFSSPDQYFDSLLANNPSFETNLPVYRGELQMHAVGCYAAQSGIKSWNRKAEHALLRAERWSVIAHILQGAPYPAKDFSSAWQAVLFNQFHDILAGSSIREAYDDARDSFGAVFHFSTTSLNAAMQRISRKVDTRGGDTAIVVFNPHSFPVSFPVEHELMTWHLGANPLSLTTESGEEIPWQEGPLSATVPPGWRKRLCFIAELPPMGYRVFYLNATETPKDQENKFVIENPPSEVVNGYDIKTDGRPDLVVENEIFRIVFDTRLGEIKQWIDKSTGSEVFSTHAGYGLVLSDPSDTWSHGFTAYRDECGRFGDGRVQIVETGPERVVARVTSSYGKSTLTQDFIIYKKFPWVEVRVTVDWHEHLKLLKLVFPVNVQAPTVDCEIPYGVIRRTPDGTEVPGQRWIDVTGKNGDNLVGLSVINESKYSFDVLESEIRMTVLRSPVYAHHTPKMLDDSSDYVYMDQGKQEFTYLLLPHQGTWKDAETVHLAEVLNMPPVTMTESIHMGDLPSRNEFLSITGPNVVLCALKVAEEGEDIVIRARETKGETCTSTIRIPGLKREITVEFTPWKVKTIRIPRDPDKPVRETNFLEE